ncbi:MAG: metallophosphoesterase family protein [Aeromicrobium erythreum]
MAIPTVLRRLPALLLLVAVAAAAGVLTTRAEFVSQERPVSIGAHEATLRPSFNGHVVINAGPLLPQVRIPADAPLNIGVRLDLGDSDAGNLDQVLARDAVIASQPQGEVERVSGVVEGIWWRAVARGVGVFLLVLLAGLVAWRAIGPARRRELASGLRRPRGRVLAGLVGVAVVTAAGVVLVAAPQPGGRATPPGWSPIRDEFPELPAIDDLDRVEVSTGSATRSGKSLVEGAVKTYRESQEFYEKLRDTAKDVEGIRQPGAGETTAIVVTDRHDNIAMDPVVRELARSAKARMLLDLGDDTSNGGSWEEFSINSLARIFRGFDVVAIAGNHDTGPMVPKVMRQRGFTVLDGKPVDVDGIRFIGQSDPRSSGLTRGYTGDESDNIDAVREQDAALTKAACADGRVAVAMVHSNASARKLSRSGCVDLVLSGHLHRQVGPTRVEGENGRSTTTLTTGTTGGAVYAFALGTGLRREAQTTIVTFDEDGRPVGLQVVSIEPGGTITPADYVPVEPSPRDSAQAAPIR